jgi:hypothetical protein
MAEGDVDVSLDQQMTRCQASTSVLASRPATLIGTESLVISVPVTRKSKYVALELLAPAQPICIKLLVGSERYEPSSRF